MKTAICLGLCIGISTAVALGILAASVLHRHRQVLPNKTSRCASEEDQAAGVAAGADGIRGDATATESTAEASLPSMSADTSLTSADEGPWTQPTGRKSTGGPTNEAELDKGGDQRTSRLSGSADGRTHAAWTGGATVPRQGDSGQAVDGPSRGRRRAGVKGRPTSLLRMVLCRHARTSSRLVGMQGAEG